MESDAEGVVREVAEESAVRKTGQHKEWSSEEQRKQEINNSKGKSLGDVSLKKKHTRRYKSRSRKTNEAAAPAEDTMKELQL